MLWFCLFPDSRCRYEQVTENVKNTTFEKEPIGIVSDLEAIIEEKKPLKSTTESVVIDDNDADSKKIDSVFSDSVEKEPIKDGIDSNTEAKPFKTTMESVEIDTESKNVSKIDFSDFETKNDESDSLNRDVLDNVVIDSDLSDLKTKKCFSNRIGHS